MLAAGMGRRMNGYAQAIPKCLIEVGGQTLLERCVESLKIAGVERFTIVTGWNDRQLLDYIRGHITGIDVGFIYNKDYSVTNNIYSLYLAKDILMQDDTLLLESDLIYEKDLLHRVIQHPAANLAVVAKYASWMDGTVVRLAPNGTICEFIGKEDFKLKDHESYYKTVNIYKFSREFSSDHYVPCLNNYLEIHGKSQYYEMVLKELAQTSQCRLAAFSIENTAWYEIDNTQDLCCAVRLFDTEKK